MVLFRGGGGGGGGPKRVKKVFFKNVAFETSAAFLLKKFKRCGHVENLDLWKRPDGRSKGRGTVLFATYEAAEEAVRTLMDTDVDGRPLWVELGDGEEGKGEGKGGSKKGFGKGDVAGGARVFFKNVLFETPEAFLRDLFAGHGRILHFDMWKHPDGRHKGNGTVDFSSPAEALAAVQGLDGAEVDGRAIHVEFSGPSRGPGEAQAFSSAAPRPPPAPGGKGGKGFAGKGFVEKGGGKGGPCRLFFRNVLFETTQGFLTGLFKKHGHVVECELWKKPDGRSRGCGVVEFGSPAHAASAMDALDGHDVDGRPLMLEWEDPGRGARGEAGNFGGHKGDGKFGGGKDGGKGGGDTTVVFRNVLFETPARFMMDLFKKYGYIKAFDLWRTPEGRSKGVGSVVFKKAAEAHAAVSELNGAEVDGRIISVEIESGGKGGGREAAGKGGGREAPGGGGCRVFFKNVLFETPVDFVRGVFRKFGHVVSFEMSQGPDGRSKGLGVVQYRTPAEAHAAIAALDGADIDGRQVVVELEDPAKALEKGKGKGKVAPQPSAGSKGGAKGAGRGGGSCRVFFHNVLFETTPGYLMSRFKPFGTVVALDLYKTPDGRSKGVGTVDFAHPAEAQAAVAGLNGKEVDGRPIGVDFDDPTKAPESGGVALYGPVRSKGKGKGKGKHAPY